MNLEERIVAWAQQNGLLPELCEFVDYDPDIGRVPEHWVPRGDVLALVRSLAAPPAPQAAAGALTMAEGIGKHGVVKQWPDVAASESVSEECCCGGPRSACLVSCWKDKAEASVAGLSGDAEREAFEAWFALEGDPGFLVRRPAAPDEYVEPDVQASWEAWQARAALHSTGKPDVEVKRYTVERHGNGWAIYTGRDFDHHGMNWGQLSECDGSLARRIEAALNAATADAPVAEPVGVVSDLFPSLRRKANDRGIPDDAHLYTRPPAPEDAKDAARYRWLRGDSAMGFGHPRWACWQVQTWGGNPLHWGNVAGEALDAAIDAALSQGGGA